MIGGSVLPRAALAATGGSAGFAPQNIALNSRHTQKPNYWLPRPPIKKPAVAGFVMGGGVTRTHEARRRRIYRRMKFFDQ